jgi:hypothetical protein
MIVWRAVGLRIKFIWIINTELSTFEFEFEDFNESGEGKINPIAIDY